MRTMPRARASGRSPLLVSSAMAVVITRVTPSMLPPTIITAPTSEAARPKPASTTVRREKRVSHRSVGTARSARDAERGAAAPVLVPRVLDELAGQRGDDRQHEHRLRHDDRRRREEDAQRAERPGAREQQVDDQAHHHVGSPSSAFRTTMSARRPGKRPTAMSAPRGSPTTAPATAAASASSSDSRTIPASSGSAPPMSPRATPKLANISNIVQFYQTREHGSLTTAR